jgi:serine/threonine-protein kinase
MPANPFPIAEVTAAFNGRYVIGSELRVGGQGVVYRATRVRRSDGSSCNEDVALKLHLDAKQDKRVEREIEAMKHLRHPALATLLEEGTIIISGKNTRFIAWEFIEGDALDTKLSRGPLQEEAVIRIAADVTGAIVALWSRRIVHRDITPKNIMIKPDGRAILIDLGGARHLDNTTITAPGLTFGTMGYFSPEQCRAERALTSASDIFTLAVVLLECLVGHHPTNLDQQQLATTPPSANALIPSCGPEFRGTIDEMLGIRASFRPQIDKLHDRFERLSANKR